MTELKIIADIQTDFPEKFGIPRQSGLIEGLRGKIVFRSAYRTAEAVRGIEGFSHLWLLWGFSKVTRKGWSATVAPPRLGGKKKMGVFATRSPYRPNPIGLSSVKLEHVEIDPVLGPVLYVSGIDMLDGTPIYDIKPYLPYADSHPDARGGFGSEVLEHRLSVVFPPELLQLLPESERDTVISILEEDPRTAYIHDDTREWGVSYAGYNILFYVKGDVLTVCGVETL
ncbi:MAG: tRNA (N6-threonylcarbamoyladenosine(37)-N6)-methyltransferase TrmO [Ruminococcaceae bacterium]|nr:tRNA (N6-threonylcarbamoyladenosine(37)-N6)-methyltransferase TrmO [Oscillospiraceae bacterium]